MRDTFINTLISLAENDSDIVLLTGDLGYSVFEKFAEKFPDQFINMGIAEQNMIGVAAGLALAGKKPYVYSIIPFLVMRAFEQIRIDICYQELNVTLVGVGGGLAYGAAGATHHAIEDIALMRSLPGLKIYAPGDPVEAEKSFLASYTDLKPVYIRLSNNKEPVIHDKKKLSAIEKLQCIKKGKEILILVTSNMLESAFYISSELSDSGINIGLCSCCCLKPFDLDGLIEMLNDYSCIITLEEHSLIGGLFSIVSESLALNHDKIDHEIKVVPFGIKDQFSHIVGSQSYIREVYGIDRKSIIQNIYKIMEEKAVKNQND